MEHNCLCSSMTVLYPREPGPGRLWKSPCPPFQGVLLVILAVVSALGRAVSPHSQGDTHGCSEWRVQEQTCSPQSLCSPCALNLGKCAKADRFLLPPLLACPAEENNQRWPPQRSGLGRITVASCCWQHVLEKGFQTGFLGTLLFKTLQFLLHISCVRGRKSLHLRWSFSVWCQ